MTGLTPDDNGAPITQYRYQWKSGGQNYSGGRSGTTTATSVTVDSLTDGTEYDFRVRATNSVGNGPNSEEASATPEAPVVQPTDTAPATPAAPSHTVISDTEILWTWTAPDDGGAQITDYDIQWRLDGQVWSGNIINLDESCYLLTGLTAATAYDARVRARNSVGTSSWSTESTATTDDAPITSTIPDTASAPDAQAGNALVRWVATATLR